MVYDYFETFTGGECQQRATEWLIKQRRKYRRKLLVRGISTTNPEGLARTFTLTVWYQEMERKIRSV